MNNLEIQKQHDAMFTPEFSSRLNWGARIAMANITLCRSLMQKNLDDGNIELARIDAEDMMESKAVLNEFWSIDRQYKHLRK